MARLAGRAVIEGRSFVVLYGESWRSPLRTSKHHLAEWLARRNTVLYVEDPLHPLSAVRHADRRRTALAALRAPLEHVKDGLHVLRPFAALPYHRGPWPLGSERLNAVNQSLVAPQLRRAMRRLAIERPILVLYLGHAAPMIPRLAPEAVVFHLVDDFTAMRGYPLSYARLEEEALRASDLVIATSARLAELRGPFCRRIEVVRHGAFVEEYSRAIGGAVPDDLARLPRPIVGYHGALHKLDFDLVRAVAALRASFSFVLIGPTSGIQGVDVDRLRAPNVHLLGPRPFAEIPRYVTAFDVAMLPFQCNRLTESMCPIKMFEYLAAGLPMVGTRLPELELFSPWVRVAEGAQGFAVTLDEAVALRDPEDRAARSREATNHDWPQRLRRIEALVERIIA